MRKSHAGGLMGDNLNNDEYGLPDLPSEGIPGMTPFLNGNATVVRKHFPYLLHHRAQTDCEACHQAFANDIHGLFWQLQDPDTMSPTYFWKGEGDEPMPQRAMTADNEAFLSPEDSVWDEVPSLDDPGYMGPGMPESGRDEDEITAEFHGSNPWDDANQAPDSDSLDEGTLGGPQDYHIGGDGYQTLIGMGHRYCPSCRAQHQRQSNASDDGGMYRQFQIQYNDGNVLGLYTDGPN